MYALIVKHGKGSYELQYKPNINSRIVTFAERCPDPNVLKMSMELDWQQGNQDNVLWISELN